MSQDEVDALLEGVKEGAVALDEKPASGQPRPYNLVGEERSVSSRFPGLEVVHDRLVRHLRDSFGGLLGIAVGVEIASAELLRYARFRNRIEAGAPLSLFSIVPASGNGLLVLSPALLFQIVDRIFGGRGRPPETFPQRELSGVELQVVARTVGLILGDLERAWSMVGRLECSFLRTESNLAVVGIAAPEDVVFAMEIQIDLGVGPARFVMAMPVAVLEPVKNAVAEAPKVPAASDHLWREALAEAIQDADVELAVELGRRELSAGELLRLEVGNVLHLTAGANDPVAICVEGERLMTGLAGVNRGQHAVRVLTFAQEI